MREPFTKDADSKKQYGLQSCIKTECHSPGFLYTALLFAPNIEIVGQWVRPEILPERRVNMNL